MPGATAGSVCRQRGWHRARLNEQAAQPAEHAALWLAHGPESNALRERSNLPRGGPVEVAAVRRGAPPLLLSGGRLRSEEVLCA